MTTRDSFSNAADTVGFALTAGVLVDVVPLILGVLGIVWFVIRIANFIRVAVFKKPPWNLGS